MAITPQTWEAIRTAFVNGVTVSELAAQHGIKANSIVQRARRHGWRTATQEVVEQETRVKEMVQTRADEIMQPAIEEQAQTLAAKGLAFVQRMGRDVDRMIEHMEKGELPKDLEELETRERIMGNLNKRGRSTFGLDQESGRHCVVNVAIMGEVLSAAQPIDVEATTTN